jgi:hypothetical protein
VNTYFLEYDKSFFKNDSWHFEHYIYIFRKGGTVIFLAIICLFEICFNSLLLEDVRITREILTARLVSLLISQVSDDRYLLIPHSCAEVKFFFLLLFFTIHQTFNLLTKRTWLAHPVKQTQQPSRLQIRQHLLLMLLRG